MKPDLTLKKNERRSLALHLALLLLAIYLLTYRGGFHSVDEVSMFAVTESLVKFGRFDTDQIAWTQWTTSQAEAQGFFGRGGHVYSKKGLALSLAQAPLYWLALYLPGLGMLQTVSLLNAFITAATGFLICLFVQRLGFSNRTALLVSLAFGLATLAFVYAKYLFSEPLAGFLLLLAAYMLFVYRQEGGLRHLIIAGLAAGCAVLTRANNLFLLPVFGLYLLWILYRAAKGPEFSGSVLMPAAAFFLSTAFAGGVLMAYNGLRAGNPLQTGYDLTLFSPNVLLGLYKLLLSPLRGFFIYSPILIMSLPGWWLFRRSHTAEAWLFAGLAGVTIGLFSAWSSGEGLSWGSRFLVPIVPFFAIALAPIIQKLGPDITPYASSSTRHALRSTQSGLTVIFYVLLAFSFFIQLLGVAINPWVFLSRLQTDFGGEFFLENTAALYNFRFSQIVGQIQNGSLQNSDLAWWQPWGFDPLAFGLSLGFVVLAGWLLWRQVKPGENFSSPLGRAAAPLLFLVMLIIVFVLLARYYRTDQQFGPPDDPYIRALNTAATQAHPADQLVTVAPYHYHVPMNRFKARLPITGLAQQSWPPADTALPLLQNSLNGQNTWLITVGVPPAAASNAAEQWLVRNAFAASNDWLDDVRLVRFSTQQPSRVWPVDVILGNIVRLVEVKVGESLQPGQALPVEFIWQPRQQPSADYNLFLQLLSPAGTVAAQHDSPPNSGYSPTSTWQPGQTLVSRHALALPPHLPPGDYRLITGLYDPTTGQRLTVEPQGDVVELGQLSLNADRPQ